MIKNVMYYCIMLSILMKIWLIDFNLQLTYFDNCKTNEYLLNWKFYSLKLAVKCWEILQIGVVKFVKN